MRSPHVEFGMYPFASAAWAWQQWWSAVSARISWVPTALTWSGDVHARWSDGDCLVTQICGGPLVATHRDDLRVLGAFSLDLPTATRDARYRSVLLSPHDRPVEALAVPTAHAVANSADSLSGWISLRAATVGAGAEWPGTVTFTGSHLASVRTLAGREGDVASIDAWSLAFIADEEPELLHDLHVVGHGPAVPTPAIAARSSIGNDMAAELRDAVVEATVDPATSGPRAALRITGFVPLDVDDYLPIAALDPGV